MSEKLLINDIKSNNSEVMSNNEELKAICVCITSGCLKIGCKSRGKSREFCPEQSGPVDWKGRSINEQRKTDY